MQVRVTEQARAIKQQNVNDNKARVEQMKVERRFLSRLRMHPRVPTKVSELDDVKALVMNSKLSAMDEIRKELQEENERRRQELLALKAQRRSVSPQRFVEPLKCVGSFKSTGRCMATTHGGSTIWTAEGRTELYDQGIHVRNGVTGEKVYHISCPDVEVTALMPGETTMWVGLSNGGLRIYDQQVFVMAFEGHAHTGAITAFTQSFDGKTFSCGEDAMVIKWDTEENNFEVTSRIEDFRSGIHSIYCYGHELFVGADDGSVSWFDSETSALKYVFTGHTGRVTAIVVLEGLLFTSSLDGLICVWNMSTESDNVDPDGNQRPLACLENNKPVTALMADPIAHHLWSADATGLKVWSSKIITNFALIHYVKHETETNIASLQGIVAVDSVKMWTFGSNGDNKVWHASKNRIEEAVQEALRAMKQIIDEDEVELQKWTDLLNTLRNVALKLQSNIIATLRTTSDREKQRTLYFLWLRYLIVARMRRTKRIMAARLEVSAQKETLRKHYARMLRFLFERKRQRSNEMLSNLLASMSKHRQQYDSSRRLQLFVQGVKHARETENSVKLLMTQSNAILMRDLYDRWLKLRTIRIENRKKAQLAARMAAAGDLSILAYYYTSWARYLRQAPQRRAARQLAHNLGFSFNKNLLLKFYRMWHRFTNKRIEQKVLARSAALLLKNNSDGLMLSYYKMWFRFAQGIKANKLNADARSKNAELAELRRQALRCEGIVARRRLIQEAQEAIDMAKEARDRKLLVIQELMEKNEELAENIRNKNWAKKVELEKTVQEQVVDLLAMLKCKLLNFHTDFPLINKIADRCKKLPPSKIFLEAHQEVKRVVVGMTGNSYDAPDTEWPLTDTHIANMKKFSCEAVLVAIKTMIITFDVMTPQERDSLSTDEEIAINAKHLEKIADKCIEVRIGRYGKQHALMGKPEPGTKPTAEVTAAPVSAAPVE